MDIDGRLEGVQPYAIHGMRYYRVYYSHADDPETIHQAQLPNDAFDEALRPAHVVRGRGWIVREPFDGQIHASGSRRCG